MKELPDSFYTGGLQPFSSMRGWASESDAVDTGYFKEIDNATWKAGIGNDNVAKGDVSLADANSFLSECSVRACLMEMGYFPGTFFLNADGNKLQMFQIPSKCAYPVTFESGHYYTSCVPVKTRWHRDCLVPKYTELQANSSLGFQITMSALPSPGTSGAITGSTIVCPMAGWLNIDMKIDYVDSITNLNGVEMWLRTSNSSETTISEVPELVDPKVDYADFIIFSNGFQTNNMIPVSKGAKLSLFASVAQNIFFDDIYFNLRLLSPEDTTDWS